MAAVPFLESRIDTRITQGAASSIQVVGRTKRYAPNGRMVPNFAAARLKHHFDLSHGVRSRAQFQALVDAFYVVMLTPYTGLRLKDPRDFQALRTNTSLASLGSGNWQLLRKHQFGGATVYRDIVKPVTGTVVVLDAGGSALTATVDYTTGIAAVTGTPASWTGEFDVPVTFTDDEWVATLEIATDAQAWMTSGAIKLEELLP